MGRKLEISDRPTEELCEAIHQIAEEASKFKKSLEQRNASVDDKFRKKKETRIFEILNPRDTDDGLRAIWNYPIRTEEYNDKKNLVAQCPYVLLGALEIDLMYIDWNRQTQLWLLELLRRYYPEMLEIRPDGYTWFYLPYTVNIREGAFVPLMGQGPFVSKTVASLGQRLVKALSLKGNPLRVYIATDSSGSDMPEFSWLAGLKGSLEYKTISVPQAERAMMDFLGGKDPGKGSTVILTQGSVRGNDIYRALKNRRLSRNGSNLYVVAAFNDGSYPDEFNLYDNYYWQRCHVMKDLGEHFLTERLIPFRIGQSI